MRRILVLGGTGAMGTYLVPILSDLCKYEIHVTSRSSRVSSYPNVKFLKGNARDNEFLYPLLRSRYDVIIDFMNYDLEEFAERCKTFLSSCDQYIWFSSSRVYADSINPLTEKSPRLLETSVDSDFLATNRYALRKARQEDFLKNTGYRNYTIIRPYITYSNDRLQLGIYEKEQWLYRLLKGRSLVINKNILGKQTTLSHGYDVSLAVSKLIDNPSAMGEVVQIASSQNMSWMDILNLYISVIKQKCNLAPRIYVSESLKAIEYLYEGGYNTIYDRVYNRYFDSSFLNNIMPHGGKINYRDMRSGLSECLSAFLDGERRFLKIDWRYEAYQDILTGDIANADEFTNEEEKILYYNIRNTPITEINGLEFQLEEITFE